ncbi:hypothetical protein CHH57_03595 [Niallia circulans]|uniref:AB hydrolase-1 domain-containing protein n=1 Tax=Niallia circulans TaxID=1397 RepID=A0AA91Z2P9_NIACI|nr:alpha/beta hydrolase [Niallia circulans]PAD84684.1 hypothetical protein CHH57_03595 [Niallia circulans]
MYVKTRDGLLVYYEMSGNGNPCLYLHGGPGYWSKPFQLFAHGLLEKDLQMIYLDQRGCGRSEHSLSHDYSLNRLIMDLEELRISLGINKWYIMGHSFGGILAVNYAARFPEHTIGLILANVTLNMYESFEYQINRGLEILQEQRNIFPSDPLEDYIELFYSTLFKLIENGRYDHFQYTDIDKKKEVDMIDKELRTDAYFQKKIFSLKEYFDDFTELLREIQKPTLIIAGKSDHAVGTNHHLTFPCENAVIHYINGGHHPYIENQDAFKEAVLSFVNDKKTV